MSGGRIVPAGAGIIRGTAAGRPMPGDQVVVIQKETLAFIIGRFVVAARVPETAARVARLELCLDKIMAALELPPVPPVELPKQPEAKEQSQQGGDNGGRADTEPGDRGDAPRTGVADGEAGQPD